MQILDLPSIPKEKKALQAIINEARHRAWLMKWVKRLVVLVLVGTVSLFSCRGSEQQANNQPAVVSAGGQNIVYLPFIER